MSQPPPGRRVSVRGTTGSGKSTLGRALAAKLGVPYVEMDAFAHLPGWQARPTDEFRALVAESIAGESWVIDGNYNAARDIVHSRADTYVWLDYPFPTVFGRLLRRTLHRCVTGQVVCNGNRETLRKTFFDRESILWWCVKTHARRHRDCAAFMSDPVNADKILIHFKHPSEADRWLADLPTT